MGWTTMQITWVAVFLASVVFEAVSNTLIGIWFGIGAAAAYAAVRVGLSAGIQWIIFILVSILCLALFRSMALKKMHSKTTKTNVDELIGLTGTVTEEIDNVMENGTVTVKGNVWSARSADGASIPLGALVSIETIEGVKLIVTKK